MSSTMVSRALSCEGSGTEPSMPAPIMRSASTSAVPSHSKEQTRCTKRKQRICKVTAAFVRTFSKDQGAVTQQRDVTVDRLSLSEPRISALPTSIVRSRKEGTQIQQERPKRPQGHLMRCVSFNPLATRGNSQQANATFFEPIRQVSGQHSRIVSRAQPSPNEQAHLVLGTVQLRDEQIRRLRNASQEQERAAKTNRKLVSTYIERNRQVSAEASEWQDQCEQALKLADHWKLEAEKHSKIADTFQQEAADALTRGHAMRAELSAAQERCDQLEEEKATVQYELALMRNHMDILGRQKSECLNALQTSQHECKVLRAVNGQKPEPVDTQTLLRHRQDALAALQWAQNDCERLKEHNERLARGLESARNDYELLLDLKVAKYIEDPTSESPVLMRPDERRDLQSALDQSQRNHEAERQLHSQAFDLAQQYKKEAVDLQEENKRLSEKMEQLEKRNSHEAMQEKHLVAIKDLFMAGKLFADESDLAMRINLLTQQVIEEKVSLESLAKLMHENSDLKDCLQKQAHLHRDELATSQTEVERAKEALSGHDLDQLQKALELETVRQEMKAAVKRVMSLTEERHFWRTHCTASLQEKEQALFSTMENRLAFYKNVSQDQQEQIESLAWDLVMMRDWANDEVSNAGMYLEERDWYKAQVEAYEAQFEELEDLPLQIPFRPVWRTLSDHERRELRQEEAEHQAGGKEYGAYRAVREAYLEAESSDHEALAAQVAEDAEEVQQREAIKTLRQGHQQPAAVQSPAPPVGWGAVVPQLPVQRDGNGVQMLGVEGKAESKSHKQQEMGSSAVEATPGGWGAVIPQPLGQLGKRSPVGQSRYHDDFHESPGVITDGLAQDNWETVGAEAVGHAWNDPQVFSSLDEDD